MAAQGSGAKSGGTFPSLRSFGAKNSHLSPKIGSKPGRNAQEKGNSGSSALQVYDMSQKRPKMAPEKPRNLRNVHQHPEAKDGPYLGRRGSKPNSEGTYSTRKHPLFVVSTLPNRPNGCLDPRTSGHLVQPEGTPARARRGPTVGPRGSPGRKK